MLFDGFAIFKILLIFLLGCFSFSVEDSLYVLNINPLLIICVANNFFKFVDGYFILRNSIF